jgi:hypothetical protein
MKTFFKWIDQYLAYLQAKYEYNTLTGEYSHGQRKDERTSYQDSRER